LAVQGLVHPDKVWTKAGALPGDSLVLSKPLGTGIILAGGGAAQKAGAIVGMRTLNRAAAEALAGLGDGAVHAATDVTGFGLLGHSWEMAERSAACLRIDASTLPLYDGVLAAAEAGVRTGGDARNRTHLEGKVTSTASPSLEAVGFDPQTSGGLLAAVSPVQAEALTSSGFTVIGEVVAGSAAVELV